ncbi:hypothetical protein V6N12_030377 [Hibiscus sabdariffa]|uniref:Uncharacterized protein n=1 Tax=Hibiscus sabdariffa TaxID=183260 RepID=A0ABR2C0Q8_9ROSI
MVRQYIAVLLDYLLNPFAANRHAMSTTQSIHKDQCYYMHCHKEYLIIPAVVGGLDLCTTFAVVVWLLAYEQSKKRRRCMKLSNPAASALVPPSSKIFTGDELRSVTENFSEGNRLHGGCKDGWHIHRPFCLTDQR